MLLIFDFGLFQITNGRKARP